VLERRRTNNHLEVQNIEATAKNRIFIIIISKAIQLLQLEDKDLLLKSRGLYRMPMETKIEPTSANEKSLFLNRRDMAFKLIYLSLSPEIQFHVE